MDTTVYTYIIIDMFYIDAGVVTIQLPVFADQEDRQNTARIASILAVQTLTRPTTPLDRVFRIYYGTEQTLATMVNRKKSSSTYRSQH